MKKLITIGITLLILIVLDLYAVKGIGDVTPVYQREFLYQYFSGNAGDWLGLITFNLLLIGICVAQVFEIEVYQTKGYGEVAIIGILLIASILSIYLF